MKAAVITRSGGFEVFQLLDRPDPEPGPGEVRVRTRFAGVNFADTSARMGIYPDAPKPPCVVGYEVSGTVDKLGPDVTDLAVGDRVMAMILFGGYAELCCPMAAATRRIPEGRTDEEGAALPVNYITAYHMLHYLTTVRPGDRVLIHAAAGGVGIAATQMCRAAGAEIFGTASAGKHDFLRQNGVAHCIDYRTQQFADEVMRITGGEGVDIVLDALGGSALAHSYRVLRHGGRLFTFGFSRATPGGKATRALFTVLKEYLRIPKFHPLKLMDQNRAVLGVNMNHMAERPEVLSAEMDGLVSLMEQGVARPRVDQVFPAAEAGEAHRYLQQGKNIGKVLLEF